MYQFEKIKYRGPRFDSLHRHFVNINKIYNFGGECISYLTLNKGRYLRFFKAKPKKKPLKPVW